jgi:D-glycero-alpha-D-manno-heptose 1-phosphate guanylyltransferase
VTFSFYRELEKNQKKKTERMSEKEEDNDQSRHFNVIEVIILAGGLGIRLQETVPHLPKVLAPVAGRPFLTYVIDYLRMQGISRFVFSLGYKAEVIEQFLKEHYTTLDYTSVTEDEPLGTGGGIRLALQKIKTDNVLVVNGDTLFKVDVEELYNKHIIANAECTIALKTIDKADRYGVTVVNSDSKIVSFNEKGTSEAGLINTGVYLLNRTKFFNRSFPFRFSFEKAYLQSLCYEGTFYGSVQDKYFIDIGVPADYDKARQEFARPILDLKKVDNRWTLFIDRDGVINEETIGEYILHWDKFVFSKGVLHAFKKISDAFGRLLVVTNQKGVGKGLMTKESLYTIHHSMQREVEVAGGRIDKIYFCTDLDNTSLYRKPNPGMAMHAKKEFPDIDFTRSIMVGNKRSDMQFGRAAGMFTVFLATTNPEEPFPHPDIDLRFSSLAEFAEAL